jgi:hypothetical protein
LVKCLFDGNYMIERILQEEKESLSVPLPSKRSVTRSGAIPVRICMKPVSFNDNKKFEMISTGDIVLVDIARIMEFDGGEIIREDFIMALCD